MKLISIYVAFPDEKTAAEVVEKLLDERLIACANVFTAQSFYRWDGKLEKAAEAVAFCKTVAENWPRAAARIAELHPFEVPAILRFEVEAAGPYAGWVAGETAAF